MTGNRGFTLIEVLVALSLASVVVVMAHRLFTGILDGDARAREARTTLDEQVNVRRRLTSLVGSLEVGPTEADAFLGEPSSVSFTAWDRDARGWILRRRVTMQRVENRLLLNGIDASPVCLADSVRSVGFDYLLEPGAAATWVKRWSSTATAPLALRLRVSRIASADTLLLIIGSRG